VVYILGVAAALFYGLASVMQHRVAVAVPREHSLRLGLLSHLVRRPLWTAGIGADIVAFLLHAESLAHGPLTLVQPLLTTGLLFALVVAAVWDRRRLAGREWLAALALMAGLALFLSVSSPTPGRPTVAFSRWIGVGLLVGAASALLVLWARRASPRIKPVALAIASAITFAASDALVKTVVDVFHSGGLVEVLDGWSFYALIVVSMVGTLLVQSAFQAGPLALSLPTLTAVEPVASSAIGVALFAEGVRGDPLAIGAEVVAAVLVLAGIWILGRSPTVTGPEPRAELASP
jgi:drug/metabolite transporter (DMT)-like permease